MTGTRDASPQTGPGLVEAKLASPRARASVVTRPRLFDTLDRLDDAELTLVSAPAGSGKTVLVSSWLAVRAEITPAWVVLDVGDDDPLRLWTYIAEAIDRVRPGIAQPALAILRLPRPSIQAAIDQLLNSLAGGPGSIAIVLDDLHHVRNTESLRLLSYAVERLPAQVRVIATSRTDPGIRLARLRARGALGEIRAQDLAFTVDEARQLLIGKAGIALHDGDVELLVASTEGWPAGIGLAGLWLARVESPTLEIREFSGTHRHVADYLTSEVLDALDGPTRDFLLRTSIFDRFNAEVCDAVLDTADAADRLEALERSNLFVIPLDASGVWYRYHHLFRELLRAELDSISPDAAGPLHARAAEWFLAQDDQLEPALGHLAATGDYAGLADLLAAQHLRLIRAGHVQLLLSWVQRLPADELAARPTLAAASALAAGMLAESAALCRRLANIAEAGLDGVSEQERTYVETLIAITRTGLPDSDLGIVLEQAQRAVELSGPVGETAVVAVALQSYARYLAGDELGALGAADQALARPEAPQRPHGLIFAHAVRAMLECDAGRPTAGEAEARQAVAVAGQLGLLGVLSAGIAHHALGYALLRRGQPVEAERELQRAELLRRSPQPRLDHAHSLLVLAAARVARGKLTLAAAELTAAHAELGAFREVGRLAELAADVERARNAAADGTEPAAEPPSPAELAVLRLLATDLSQREIGAELFLTMNTVKSHTAGLYRKLGVHSRDEALRKARAIGLLADNESPG